MESRQYLIVLLLPQAWVNAYNILDDNGSQVFLFDHEAPLRKASRLILMSFTICPWIGQKFIDLNFIDLALNCSEDPKRLVKLSHLEDAIPVPVSQ